MKSGYGMRVNEMRRDKSRFGLRVNEMRRDKSRFGLRVNEMRRDKGQMRDASERDTKRLKKMWSQDGESRSLLLFASRHLESLIFTLI
nr:hypothetical protein BCU41_05355 [Vibrio lentus]